MGQPVIVAFAALAVLGFVLLGMGLMRGNRAIAVVGGALLLGLVGAWVFGVYGVALGLLALGFWKPRPAGNSPGAR